MIGTFALLLAVSADPRPALVQLQLDGRPREALARTERELADDRSRAHLLGLDYLRGRLLAALGRPDEAAEAFAAAMAETPVLALYSRYRLALLQELTGHPEVAAGLVATAAAGDPSSPLQPQAVKLLCRTLAKGGDCRLLQGLTPEKMELPERRQVLLAQADCALRGGQREFARGLLVSLLVASRDDETARQAAERLAGIVSDAERGEVPRLLGLTFEQHREFERALKYLHRAADAAESERDAFAARYAMARALFWQGRYGPAAVLFGELAAHSGKPDEKSLALYQQGRSYELLGHWKTAAVRFRRAYLASPAGEWASAALVSALRLEWRSGEEGATAELYRLLGSRLPWRDQASRAALFMASSDLVRGRGDRARVWLDQAAGFRIKEDQIEVAYWRGRLAELAGDSRGAVAAYLTALRGEIDNPISQAAYGRLTAPALARVTAAEGRRLAASPRPDSLYGACILLGEGDPVGAVARRKLRQALLADASTSPFLRLAEVPVGRWRIWRAALRRPEETLLALGIWHEGAPAVREQFPPADPSLAFTGAAHLSRAGEPSRAMALAEAVRLRTPDVVPLAMQPAAYQQLLYPLAYGETLAAEGHRRGVDPRLLAAIFREESRFDPQALSGAAARGLAQLVIPTARRLANGLQLTSFDPEDLYRPEVAIPLGAAYVAELLHSAAGSPYLAVAAYNAGEPEAQLWRAYCYSAEPEEFLTKVGFKETRSYLRRVLTSWAQYQRLYP